MRQKQGRLSFWKRESFGKQAGSGGIEVDLAVGMGLQDAGRVCGVDGSGEAIADSGCLSLVGYGADDPLGREDLPDGHADGLSGYVVEGGKPAFAELLFPAVEVEVDD